MEEMAEYARVLPPPLRPDAGTLVRERLAEELDGAAVPDEVREALVEIRLAGGEVRAVRDLVDHGLDEPQAVQPQRRRHDGVGEPAQRREGGDRPERDVVAFLGQAGGLRAGVVEVEVSLVGEVADDGEPPRLPAQRELRGGEHVQDQRVAVKLRERLVARPRAQPQVAFREVSRVEDEPQLVAGLAGHGRVVDHGPDGAARRENAGLLPAGAQDVRRRAAARAQQEQHERGARAGDG